MFSLAVLSVMVTLAMDMVIAVAGSFWAGDLVGDLMGDAGTEGITSRALQQGGLGLILTMLIISAPPMAASFFQGTLGSFMAYSQFGGTGGASAGSRPGEPGYRGPAGYSPPPQTEANTPVQNTNAMNQTVGSRNIEGAPGVATGRLGQANLPKSDPVG
jgi:type IV secretion system protein VirB6